MIWNSPQVQKHTTDTQTNCWQVSPKLEVLSGCLKSYPFSWQITIRDDLKVNTNLSSSNLTAPKQQLSMNLLMTSKSYLFTRKSNNSHQKSGMINTSKRYLPLTTSKICWVRLLSMKIASAKLMRTLSFAIKLSARSRMITASSIKTIFRSCETIAASRKLQNFLNRISDLSRESTANSWRQASS